MNRFNKKISDSQLEKIERAYGVSLSPELRNYIKNHPKVKLTTELTWRSDPKLVLDAQYEMFKDMLSFDIKEGDYWPKVFGEKPGSLEQSVEKALAYLRELPPLIPVEGLKFFAPTQTSDPGMPTPVLSFEQFVDTIYAFGSIEDYLSDKRLDNETRQAVPRALGWENVIDGLGANDEDVYLSN